MMNFKHSQEFEKIVANLFKLLSYSIEVKSGGKDIRIDIIASRGEIKLYIEVKFFRSNNIQASLIKKAANRLAFYLKDKIDGSGILIINTLIPDIVKTTVRDEFGIHIWDREIIYNLLTHLSIEIRDEFEKLLLSSQQGTEITEVFKGIDPNDTILDDINIVVKPKSKGIPKQKGSELCQELKQIKCGKQDWHKYELKCVEILKYLFNDDLALWKKQSNTEDGLSRFDLICRIASNDAYWKALISSFNTRFVLFEFKNYCEQIGQGQIYTTERYLYNRALRSVGFILTRMGGKPNAVKAAKGALKEHGKLILVLSDDDLYAMLNIKDNNDSPNDYLSNLLDAWLINLSR